MRSLVGHKCIAAVLRLFSPQCSLGSLAVAGFYSRVIKDGLIRCVRLRLLAGCFVHITDCKQRRVPPSAAQIFCVNAPQCGECFIKFALAGEDPASGLHSSEFVRSTDV